MTSVTGDNRLFDGIDVPNEMRAIHSLEDAIRAHALLTPNAPAITFHDRTISYGKLDERTNRFANALLAAGYLPGDRLAVICKNDFCSYESLIAARKVGAVQVAINWRLAPSEIAWIVNDSQTKLLVVDAEFASQVPAILDSLARTIDVFIVGDADVEDMVSLDRWSQSFGATDPGYRSLPEETAIQLYTSGTTGRPKGAMLSNANLWSFFKNASDVLPMRPRGNHLIVSPLFHVAALVWSMRVFVHGGHCVGMRDFDAKQMLALIPRYRINDFATVTTVMHMLERDADRSHDYSSLDGICVGGGSLSEPAVRRMMETFGCPIYGMYGSTELTYGCTLLWIDEDLLKTPALLESCGRPFPGISLAIHDPETLEPLPDGETGELWVRGGQRSQGYWRRPEETAAAFLSDGWFRTGDMGHLTGGYLYVSDRLKDMIRTGGENVYPAEVERVLGDHPDISEVAVIGVPDDHWGESVKAVVVPRSGAEVTEAGIVAFARSNLAPFKCPRSVDLVDSIPRTASGKAMKHVIREPYWTGFKKRVN